MNYRMMGLWSPLFSLEPDLKEDVLEVMQNKWPSY
jgi:hypothetical protein